jgi:hypothetical protein
VIFQRVSFHAHSDEWRRQTHGPDLLRSLVRLASTLNAVPIASGTPKAPSSPQRAPCSPESPTLLVWQPCSAASPAASRPTTLLGIALDRLGSR